MRKVGLTVSLLVVSASLAGAFTACVGDDPVAVPQDASTPQDAATTTPDTSTLPPPDGAAPDAQAQAQITADARAFVRQGGMVEIDAKIERKGLAGELAVTVTGLPKGVTAQPAVFAAAATTTKVTLVAANDATVGEAPIKLEVSGAAPASLNLLVAGPSGTLDTTFDNDGLVLVTADPTAVFYAARVQNDGKIVAVGAQNGGAAGGGWYVKRYNADGSPDAAFNTAAAAAVPGQGMARAVAFEPGSGKVVVAGGAGATERLAVVRLNPNGAADQGFANAGTLIVDSVTHPNGSRANGVVAFGNGTVLVAGTRTEGGGGGTGIVDRYLPNGTRDPAFASYVSPTASAFTGLLPLAGTAFFVTGTEASVSPPAQIGLRLLGNGTPDATFGNQGKRTYASGCRGAASALATNGDVVITGQDVRGPSYCVTRVAAQGNGDLVYTQSIGGGNSEQFTAAASGPGNTTYAAGNGGGSQDKVAILERRQPNGNLDRTFASAGTYELEDPATPDTYIYSIQGATTGDDGRVLIVGSRASSNRGPFIARFWP
ncbi:MAG: hypothetical protein U0183_15825 [Polyangiaceae bacterium]